MSELLPCPFCGGRPSGILVSDGDYNPIGFYFECEPCGFELAEMPTEAEAEATWNRRAPLPTPRTPCHD